MGGQEEHHAAVGLALPDPGDRRIRQQFGGGLREACGQPQARCAVASAGGDHGIRHARSSRISYYHSNVECYDHWHAWLRRHTPPTLITWGSNDPFFPESGARAYLRDLPDAELHLFDTGHFALETHLPEIAPLSADFLDRVWK
ncbi:alpha/beta fold hydrolase [Streptomyces sp. NPDC001796]|uniref:alpha/beta fold hydrolase n=1 Tax=Streptomyces sp. NPDC001796 TaxID=3364609 RepID=UPI0036A26A11